MKSPSPLVEPDAQISRRLALTQSPAKANKRRIFPLTMALPCFTLGLDLKRLRYRLRAVAARRS